MLNFNDFINYVFSFYGNGGLYDQKRTKEQIAFATLRYLDLIDAADDDNYTWGNGDSLDRERVRDIMNIICQEVELPNVPVESHFNDCGVKILN
tara:strand:- start:181 stop:462 length:282 start_codon:yes stop_codon:yes gene_type:complete